MTVSRSRFERRDTTRSDVDVNNPSISIEAGAEGGRGKIYCRARGTTPRSCNKGLSGVETGRALIWADVLTPKLSCTAVYQS